jgi:phosphoglycolate phosphatase
MFHAILFDLDGTLIAHLPAIHRSYAHTLPQLGLPAPTVDQVLRAIGGGLENAMRRFVSEADLPRALQIYRAHWEHSMLDGVELMPGAAALLQAQHARGTKLAVVSNKHGPSSRRVCTHLGIDRYLNLIIGAGDTPWLKPDRRLTDHVLDRLGADRATTCFVGDSPFDVETAHQAGIPCFCVTTGTHDGAALAAARPDGVYPDLATLASAVFGGRETSGPA